jgi:LysM repeat protein
MDGISYRVKPDDTLVSIAKEHGIDLEELARFNGISMFSRVWMGQVLKIPMEGQSGPGPQSKVPLKFPLPTLAQSFQAAGAPAEEESFTIDGQRYVFKTVNNSTSIEVRQGSSPSSPFFPRQPKHLWFVTRDNGFPLFALRPSALDSMLMDSERGISPFTPGVNAGFRVFTAKQIYSKGAQWFEPLADNYRELIWVHPKTETKSSSAYAAYKHFTWKEIIDFALVDRWPISFASRNKGDWKHNKKEGAGGYLLACVEGTPYWADAIGQIPFAVDTFKSELESTGDRDKSIIQTIKTGIDFGDGSLFFAKKDVSNSYDNFMVLRGALWASANHTVTRKEAEVQLSSRYGEPMTRTRVTFEVRYSPGSMNDLKKPITKSSLSKYGVWRKK